MAPRSFRIEKDQNLLRARLFRHDVLTTSSSGAANPPLPSFAPVFLARSSFTSSFSPSLPPAPATGEHHEAVTETAVIVGGGVASVVALAATATIVSTIVGKFGVTSLLGSVGKVLSFFLKTFMGSACAQQRNSKDGAGRQRWHRRDRRQRKYLQHGAGADEMKSEESNLEWETLSAGSSTDASSKEGSLVAAAQEPDNKGSKRRKLMHDGHLFGTETADASANLDKQEIRYTGGTTTNTPLAYDATTLMLTKEKKVISSNEMMLPTSGKWAQHDVNSNLGKVGHKRKQQNNLGHVHLSCAISAHYLHLFTSCKLGTTFGSPTTSPNHTLNRNDDNICHPKQGSHQDGNSIPISSSHRVKSTSANYKTSIPMHNLSQYNSMN